jgi:hypothetical protein
MSLQGNAPIRVKFGGAIKTADQWRKAPVAIMKLDEKCQ